MIEAQYTDAKGRTRWKCNDHLAELLKDLHAYLVIGDYDESHAARYPRLAHLISRHPISVKELHRTGTLTSLPGVSSTIETIIEQFIERGTCDKMLYGDEFFTPPPLSVLEMIRIPRLGAKTAKLLYQDYGIASLAALKDFARSGDLLTVPGVGKSMVDRVLSYQPASC